jgi:hypothetical protein
VVRGLNNLDSFGRWAFEEFTGVFEMETALGRLIRARDKVKQTEEA